MGFLKLPKSKANDIPVPKSGNIHIFFNVDSDRVEYIDDDGSIHVFGNVIVTNDYAVYSGSATPTSSLGKNGDHYLKTGTKQFYKKSNGNWTVEVTFS